MGEEKKEVKADGKEKSKEERKPVGFFQLFRFSTWFDVLIILLGTLGAVSFGAVFPIVLLIFGELTDAFIDLGSVSNDTVVTTTPGERITQNAVYYAILASCVLVLGFLQNGFWNLASERQAYKIRLRFFHSVLYQDMTWFDSHQSGEIATRFADDVDQIQRGMGEKLGNVIQYVTTCIGGIVLAFVKSWQLTLVILSVTVVILVPSVVISARLIRKLTQSELDAYSKAGGIADEVLAGIRTVVAFGGQHKEAERYGNNLYDAKSKGIMKDTIQGTFVGVFYLCIYSCYGLAFWYGTQLYLENALTPGDIFITFLAVLFGCLSLGNAAPNIADLATARGAAAVIWEIIDKKSLIDSSSEEGLKPKEMNGTISFENVHFSYPSRKDVKVLNGLNLEVKVGQTVALVGSSGCGKSTTVQLVQRYYDTASGSIKLDDNDLRELNVHWLREHIGVVSQEPILFATSIAENIRYGRIEASMDDIIAATKEANAHDFISALPQGYDTLVGERGAQMSGGQKQRIAIARALVRNPRILLLDEATSALDTESEATVQAALDKVQEGRTTIVIAHRLSTVKNADLICAFQDGVIQEQGTHEELMQKPDGIYRGLVLMQGRKEEEGKEKGEEQSEEEEEEQVVDEKKDEIIEEKSKIDIERSDSKRHSGRLTRMLSSLSATSVNPPEEALEEEDILKHFSFNRVMQLNSPEWFYLIVGCISSAFAGAISPAFAVIFSRVIETFGLDDEEEITARIKIFAGLFSTIAIVAFVSNILQSAAFGKSGEELTLRLRHMTFKAMLRQDISWFDDDKHSTGALTSRLASETSLVKGVTGARIGFILQGLCNMGVGIILAFYYGWQLTLLVIAFLPLIAIAGVINWKIMSGNTISQKNAQEDVGKLVTESLDNIRTVVSLNRERQVYEKYIELLQTPYKKGIKSSLTGGLAFGASQATVYFTYAAVFSLGGFLVDRGEMEFQDIFLVVTAIIFGGFGLGRAIASAPDFGKAKVAAANMFCLFDRVPAIDSYSTEGLKPEDYTAEIKFEKLKFSYPTRKRVRVLQGLSLSVSPGETLALVGSSGCGKSTTIQLTERFYDPLDGHVILDSYDTKVLNISWLRAQIGLVSQEPVLFDCTIGENIAYGDNSRDVPIDEIIDAAKKANIYSFIEGLPLGYDTRAGEKGAQLSGGQKQRIAIARALIRNPKILLLDEATSALDTESEKVVQAALDEAKKGRTCITIAHRLSTIHEADKIAVIRHGHVTEIGTHDELMKLKGQYHSLYTAQQMQH